MDPYKSNDMIGILYVQPDPPSKLRGGGKMKRQRNMAKVSTNNLDRDYEMDIVLWNGERNIEFNMM